MFQLSDDEVDYFSRCKIFTLNTGRGSNIKYKPYAFTENAKRLPGKLPTNLPSNQVKIIFFEKNCPLK